MQTKTLNIQDLEKKACVIVGTRPGIIKMSPIIKKLNTLEYPSFVIHAGQHYSPSMDDQFFKDLDLNIPEYKLENVKFCKLHGEQTAEMLKGIEKILIKEKPKVVLVCGDANFNLSGALAARKLHMFLCHVESGLRSNDWRMPEEHNRVMIDHISDFLFSPTKEAAENAKKDNVKGEIIITGNTIVDAVYENRDIAEKRSKILEKLNIEPEKYFVLTAHREENVDSKEKLIKIKDFLEQIESDYKDFKVVFPAHYRTLKMIKNYNLEEKFSKIKNLKIIEPIGYLDFLKLLSNSRLVITDSGGIQEESCILQIPCVTIRENTERWETVEVGSNTVTGLETKDVIKGIKEMINKDRNWDNPFGDGKASSRMIERVRRCLDEK
jgi:UDP-N-acetylglucosamine 2-epimerase (non-hydrolysing)